MPPKPIPDGYHTAAPFLMVGSGAKAIEFYKQAFGAVELARLADPRGKVAHAEIKIGDSTIMLAEESPQWGNKSPQTLGGTPVFIHLYVEDVDGLAQRAVAAGAKLLIPIADQFYGDRAGRLADPFGHIWVIATRREEVSLEEIQRRFEDLTKQQSGA